MASFLAWWKRFAARYTQFVEKQGFLIIVAACVGVIAATAVWTHSDGQSPATPTPPVYEAAPAAQVQQESLQSVSTPTPAPTFAPWQPPTDSLVVLSGFDATRLKRSAVTGLWRLHDAVDLQCEVGEQIRAMAGGEVVETGSKGLLGAYVTIDHGQGLCAQYAGMTLLAGLRAGDPVEAGQVLGFAGNGVVDETDLGVHLHLRVTRDGHAIDPMSLLK